MGKVIAAINMTLDGYCDHTLITPDDEIHLHYNDLLQSAGCVLYGRITYQLMEYWPTVVKHPTGNDATDKFAITMDNIPKIVFSNTLKHVEWASARLAKKDLKEELSELKQHSEKDILIGSPGLIIESLNHRLIDELQLCVHPVVAVNGKQLFKNLHTVNKFALAKTKTFNSSGAIILYYKPEMQATY